MNPLNSAKRTAQEAGLEQSQDKKRTAITQPTGVGNVVRVSTMALGTTVAFGVGALIQENLGFGAALPVLGMEAGAMALSFGLGKAADIITNTVAPRKFLQAQRHLPKATPPQPKSADAAPAAQIIGEEPKASEQPAMETARAEPKPIISRKAFDDLTKALDTMENIDQVRRRIAVKFHPDKNPDSPDAQMLMAELTSLVNDYKSMKADESARGSLKGLHKNDDAFKAELMFISGKENKYYHYFSNKYSVEFLSAVVDALIAEVNK